MLHCHDPKNHRLTNRLVFQGPESGMPEPDNLVVSEHETKDEIEFGDLEEMLKSHETASQRVDENVQVAKEEGQSWTDRAKTKLSQLADDVSDAAAEYAEEAADWAMQEYSESLMSEMHDAMIDVGSWTADLLSYSISDLPGDLLNNLQELTETPEFTKLRHQFENGDQKIAALTYRTSYDTIYKAKLEEYRNNGMEIKQAKFNARKMAEEKSVAILLKMGVNPKKFGKFGKNSDLSKAIDGKATVENREKLMPDQKAQIKAILLPDDTILKKVVKEFTPGKELKDYQKVLLAPGEAVEGTIRGVMNFHNTVDALVQMGEIIVAENPEEHPNGVEMELIIDIIDEALSPAEKVAFIVQFANEGLVASGIIRMLGQLMKLPKVATVIDAMSKSSKALASTLGKASSSRGLSQAANVEKIAKSVEKTTH